MSEIERAVEVKRETLREEILRNKQEISQNEKRVEERTNEYLARNLSGMTREAERLTTVEQRYGATSDSTRASSRDCSNI